MRSHKTCMFNRSYKSYHPSLSLALPPNFSRATCLSFKVNIAFCSNMSLCALFWGFAHRPWSPFYQQKHFQSPFKVSNSGKSFSYEIGVQEEKTLYGGLPSYRSCPLLKVPVHTHMFHLFREGLQPTRAITYQFSQLTPLDIGQIFLHFPVHCLCIAGIVSLMFMCVCVLGILKVGDILTSFLISHRA